MATFNFIPDMTSNTTPSGVASASNEWGSGYAAWKAMDRDNGTFWATSGGITSGWIQYKPSSPEACVYYSMRVFGTYTTYMPNSWTFEASNTGAFAGEQVVLDTKTGVTWASDQTKNFFIANTTSYAYYRINISSNNGATSIIIAEIAMYADDTPPVSASITASVSSSAEMKINESSMTISASSFAEVKSNEVSMTASVSVWALPKGVALATLTAIATAYARARALNKSYMTATATVSSDGSRKSFGYGFEIVGELQLASIIQTFRFVEEVELPAASIMIQRVSI